MLTTKILTPLCYLLIAVLALIVTNMSWNLYSNYSNQLPELSSTTAIPSLHTSASQQGNISTIMASQMFYVAPPEKKAVVVKKAAPVKVIAKTKLNLKLTGLVTGDNSVAVVVYNGKQRPYVLEEFIVNTDSLKVRLVEVMDDHVIVENNGVKEQLSLPQNKRQLTGNIGIIKQR